MPMLSWSILIIKKNAINAFNRANKDLRISSGEVPLSKAKQQKGIKIDESKI